MPKTRRKGSGGARYGAGRKSLAELGRERRERRVLACFTPSEYVELERQADDEGVPVATLVAQRALLR